MKNIIKDLLREALTINEIYGKKVIDVVTKKFNDTSEDMVNKLAIASLFRNIFGDIQQYKTKEQFDIAYNKWYETTLNDLIKTTSFPENKELAKKYLEAYVNNIKSLGQSALPFSMKKIESGLVDLVNNNHWIKDGGMKQTNTIYNPKSEDVVFENNEIIILDTNTKAKCVMYGQGESWCITKPDLNYYNTYRIKYAATPYFVLQKNVQGDEHKFVIMNYGRDQYAIADRSNSGNRHGGSGLAMAWDRIEQELPNLTGLERYFPYREISDDERRYNEIVDEVKAFRGSDLQGEIDAKIKGLVINGSHVTAEDFIRDYASSGVYITGNQLDSLTKECVDSLIESGYFLHNNPDSLIQDKQLSNSQINRIIKLRTDNNFILSMALYPYLSEEDYRNYFWKRAQANKNSKNSYTDNINEKSLNVEEAAIIIKLFPDFDLNVDAYDLSNSHDAPIILMIKPEMIDKLDQEVKKTFMNWQVSKLLIARPELIPYFKEQINKMYGFQIDDLIDENPTQYNLILSALNHENRKSAISKLLNKDINYLPIFIKQGYIDINSEEDNKIYKTFYREYPKIYELNPSLLDNLDNYDLRDILVREPKLFKSLGNNMDKLEVFDIERVLEKNPKLFSYLGDYIKNIHSWCFTDVIQNKPIALNYIPKGVIEDKLDSYKITNLIISKPIVAKKLGNLISKDDVIWAMSKNPKTIKYFPESILNTLDKYDMSSILYRNKDTYSMLEPLIDKYMPDDKEYILGRMD